MERNHVPSVFTWLLAVSSVLAPAVAHAEFGDHLWSKAWAIGGVQVAVDGSGRVFAGGTTTSAVDFGGGLLTPSRPSVFLACFEADGTHRWSRLLPAITGMGAWLTALASAPTGEVYIACQIQSGSIDLGGGVLSGSNNVLLASYDVDGAHRWSFAVGPGTVYDLDADGDLLAVAARNFGTMDFGGGARGVGGDMDAVVAVLTHEGAHVWSQDFGDLATQVARDVGILPGGELVVCASGTGTLDFGGGPLVGDADYDLWIARLDASGAHAWSRLVQGSFGGSATETGMDVAADGTIALTGRFSGTVDLGGGPLVADAIDVFALKLSGSGLHEWSARFGGPGDDFGLMASIDAQGRLGLSGLLGGAVDFGGGALAHVASSDAFVAVFGADGSHLHSASFGTSAAESRHEHAVDAHGALIVHGNGGAPIDLGGGLLATGTPSSFWIAKLEGDPVSTSTSHEDRPVTATTRLFAAPNPFTGSTTLRLAKIDAESAEPVMPVDGHEVRIFDVRGRRVRTLELPDRWTSYARLEWDGRDDGGRSVPGGIYFARARVDGVVHSARLVLVP